MYEIEITDFDEWEDFDLIAQILKTKLGCKLLDKAEGPDAKIWKYKFDKVIFWLVCDDIAGNFLTCENENDFNVLNNIATQIIFFLKNAETRTK